MNAVPSACPILDAALDDCFLYCSWVSDCRHYRATIFLSDDVAIVVFDWCVDLVDPAAVIWFDDVPLDLKVSLKIFCVYHALEMLFNGLVVVFCCCFCQFHEVFVLHVFGIC